MKQIRTPGARRKTLIAKERNRARQEARDRMLITIKETQEMLSAWKLQEEQFEKEIDRMVKIHKESRVEPKPRSWLGKLFWP